MSQDETFSFRWGVPWLDEGHTSIPNFIIDGYRVTGMLPQEFAVIVHLARYQFESPDSQSFPSMKTIADQTGYTVRYLRKMFARLERMGLLQRSYRTGQTTVYDFSGFGQAVLAQHARGEVIQDRAELQDRGGRNCSSGGGGTTVPPNKKIEEEKRTSSEGTRTIRDAAAGVGDDDATPSGSGLGEEAPHAIGPTGQEGTLPGEDAAGLQRRAELLVDAGVDPIVARGLAAQYSEARIEGWIQHAKFQSAHLRNRAGYIVTRLKAGEPSPAEEWERREEERQARRAQPGYVEKPLLC